MCPDKWAYFYQLSLAKVGQTIPKLGFYSNNVLPANRHGEKCVLMAHEYTL